MTSSSNMQKNMMNNVVDYYKILQVSRRANEEELKKAYKKMAMKWHPDKNNESPMKMKEAEAKFKQIKEAYEVLGNPMKRKSYDDIGQTSHVNKSCYNNKKANNMASTDTTATTRKRKACDLGSDNPPKFENVVLKNPDENIAVHKAKDMKSTIVSEHKLVFNLEDLYKGGQRKLRISRNVLDERGNMIVVEEILEINVKAGWKKDTKITFPGKGNQLPGSPCPDDLVFVVKEKPHKIFKREGNDLITTQKISLLEALTGKTIKITTLDGREIDASITDIVKPDTKIVIEDEGMPSTSKPGRKGNLIIKFDIIFPSSLPLAASQKCELKKIFGEADD